MDNYLNSSDSYMQRMNKTANSKFKVVEPFLGKGINILDFGSGVSSEFISEVVSTGANYYAYDISLIVQTELSRMGVSVLTESDLLEQTIQFDVIYLSSVFPRDYELPQSPRAYRSYLNACWLSKTGWFFSYS